MSAALMKRLKLSLLSMLTAVRLVWHSSPYISSILLVIVLIQGIIPVFLVYTVGLMVDEISDVMSSGTFVLTDTIINVVILVGAVTMLEIIIGAVSNLLNERQVISTSDYVMKTIHEKSILIDLELYEDPSYYDILHRVRVDAPSRPGQVVNNLLQAIRQMFFLLGAIGLLGVISPWVPIILITSALPSMAVRYYFSRKIYHWHHRQTEKERKSYYYHTLLTFNVYAKELRLYKTGKLFSSIYNQFRSELRDGRLLIVGQRTLSDIIAQSIAVIALFLTLLLILTNVLAQSVTIGGFVIVFQAFQRGQTTIQAFFRNIAQLYEHKLFLDDYQSFLKLQPKLISPLNPQIIPNPMQQGITFENVSFRYPGKENLVFKDVNFTIRPHEVIALVGENGAGKTTLIKLLCRLYDPTEGRITLDGIDIREFDILAWRRMLTVMFQDYNAYYLTAKENIWLSDTVTEPNDEAIRHAAQNAGADDMIQSLENRYETMLGHWFSGGQELSIGQWQRIALARSFWRKAPIVVLDEPTSSLDVITENDIFERFERIIEGRSAILISHRLSTIRMAHKIYVLDNGHIVESGTHNDLIQQNGIYSHLFDLQAQHYTS